MHQIQDRYISVFASSTLLTWVDWNKCQEGRTNVSSNVKPVKFVHQGQENVKSLNTCDLFTAFDTVKCKKICLLGEFQFNLTSVAWKGNTLTANTGIMVCHVNVVLGQKVPPAPALHPQTWNQRRCCRIEGGEERQGTEEWRSWLKEQEVRNGNRKMSRQKNQECIWNTRLSNVMSLGDTWSLWHSIWESPEAALQERTGFLRCRAGRV